MNKVLLTLAMAGLVFNGTVSAQEAGKPQHAKLIRLQNARPTHVFNVISGMIPNGTNVRYDETLQTMAISGPPEVVAMLEDNIRKLDAPPPLKRNLEIVAYMIVGTQDAAAKAPDELAGVVKQLRGLFPFAGYKLIETMLLRCREGEGGEASGLMPSQNERDLRLYQFRFNKSFVEKDEKGSRVRLYQVRFGAKLPFQAKPGEMQYLDVGANTEVDIREGQKVVIGKASLGPGQESLFLVLSVKIVD